MGQTNITDAVADDQLDLITSVDCEISLHTGDPLKTGANEATGVTRDEILVAGWTAKAANIDYNGRETTNSDPLTFGLATVAETYSWLGIWHESDPGGAPGVYDLFRMAIELDLAKAAAIDDPVSIQANRLKLIAAGGA
jgi:hypothetical protein